LEERERTREERTRRRLEVLSIVGGGGDGMVRVLTWEQEKERERDRGTDSVVEIGTKGSAPAIVSLVPVVGEPRWGTGREWSTSCARDSTIQSTVAGIEGAALRRDQNLDNPLSILFSHRRTNMNVE
jgi:hypothetical protein